MRVAGLGFRRAASLAALADALAAALERAGPADALATSRAKADAPVILALARARGLPLIAVDVAGTATPTQSPRVTALHGTGSLAEAAALAALGPGARITVTRVTSADGMATAAIAQGDPA
ncbi:cobalamin biosynthesis protein [Paracoccus sp. (in: a-proteobacteria)]|uniref:cobalamin biosynthesis protein n=1 Tax=Paracoccus sp. TaxID=267 RepID=UPI0035AF98FE